MTIANYVQYSVNDVIHDTIVGDAPFAVTFADTSSTPSYGTTLTWFWDFGDGNTSTLQNPGIHNYDVAGTYVPILTETFSSHAPEDSGLTGNNSTIIVTTPIPPVTVNITYVPYPTVFVGDIIAFSGNLVSPHPPSYYTYQWDFGDGYSEYGIENPLHTYAFDGTYTVTLNLLTEGIEATASITINVMKPTYIDLPTQQLTDDEYANLGIKYFQSAFPQKWYDDGNYPLRTISVWPIPNVNHKVLLWLWQPLIDAQDLDTDIVFPQGYERALRFALAVELAAEFGKTVPETVKRIAVKAKATIKRLNSTPQILVGDSAIASNQQSLFNYITGDTIPTNI